MAESAMPEVRVGDATIRYEERGQGAPVVLTPGGRWGGYVMQVVAAELAKEFRVITWDRSNTDGGSSIVLEGAQSEADLWADQLAGLISALHLDRCYVGEYAGCRTTPLLCHKHPGLVKGLMLAWPSGGEVPAERLPRNMYRQYTRPALRDAMEAVADTPMFASTIRLNPANRKRLLAMDRLDFVRQMAYWETFFTTSADLATAGCRLSDAEWQALEVPAIVTGGADPVHPTVAAERIHKLLRNSEYHEPVITLQEWDKVFNVVPYPEVSNLQGARIAPVWRDFIRRHERT
jgi:pimeloyl-ACP methyl ester carboxylesterase